MKMFFLPPVWLQREVLVRPAKLVCVLAKRELYIRQIREPVKTTERSFSVKEVKFDLVLMSIFFLVLKIGWVI